MLAESFMDFDIIVLDIEGTVCPITFVHDVLFPFAVRTLRPYLDRFWDTPEFSPYQNAFPEDCRSDRARFEDHVQDLVSRDVKIPYLKALQGLLWQAGYASGELRAPVFPDVGPFITAAHEIGKRIFIYSSGSVQAQKLFFAHTTAQPSDLTPYISAWYDTVNAGAKTDVQSYMSILSSQANVPALRWLFLSDNLLEVKAALQAGMRSLPVSRPGNPPLPQDDSLSKTAIFDFSTQSELQQSLASLPMTH